jgi:hypothetical protein
MPYIIAVVVLVVAGVAFTLLQSKPEVTNTPNIVETSTTNTKVIPETTGKDVMEVKKNTPNSTASAFTDGTYSEKVSYLAPNQKTYSLDISMSVANDVISTVGITYSSEAEKDPNVKNFDKAYKTLVVGKKLNDVSLSRVGGASLTTNAFNEAIAAIKTEAAS